MVKEAKELAQQISTPVALAEDPGCVPSTLMAANSQFQFQLTSAGYRQVQDAQTYKRAVHCYT